MAQLSKRAVAVANWDNRLPIAADVAEQLQLAISNGVYVCNGVTINVLVPATMTNPNGGSNQCNFDLLVPTGTSNATIIALVTAALNGLNLPFSAITVNSVTIF